VCVCVCVCLCVRVRVCVRACLYVYMLSTRRFTDNRFINATLLVCRIVVILLK